MKDFHPCQTCPNYATCARDGMSCERRNVVRRNADMNPVTQYLAEIGAKGGKAKSKAKAKAAKGNGKKGGRPRKTPQAETLSEPANTQLAD
jgi:hypothetical protein